MIKTPEEYDEARADRSRLCNEIAEYERTHDQFGVPLVPVSIDTLKRLYKYWTLLTQHRLICDGLFDHLKALTSLEDGMRAEFSEDEIRTCFHMFGNTPCDEFTNPNVFAKKYGDLVTTD